MTKYITKIVMFLSCFSLMLFNFGCDSQQQNSNTAANQNANTGSNANVAPSPDTQALRETCEGSLEDKLKKLQEKLDKRFKDDKDIKPQLERGWFKFKTEKSSDPNGDYIVLYVEGKVIGNDHFPDLLKIAKDYMKKGCLEKVIFVPVGTIKRDAITLPPPGGGFEWIACEDPKVPCPNGYCDLPDNCGTKSESAATTTSNTSSQTNASASPAVNATRSP